MTNARLDVRIEVLGGPMASLGPQTLRGPVVPLGSNPGPGGLTLTGVRGLDTRHAVITAYAQGEATVAPVGANQVRVAPHPHVRWEGIQATSGPRALSEGCAIHLGPVGRGVTLQFHGLERLGVWQQGQLASEHAVPQGRDPRRVRRVRTGNWKVFALVGGLTILAILCVTGVVVRLLVGDLTVAELGPKTEGESYYEFVRVDAQHEPPEELRTGMEQAFAHFVVEPSAEVSGRDLSESEDWDRALLAYTIESVDQHLASWAFFRRLDAVRDDYALVLGEARRAGLPDVVAAIPYFESRYRAQEQSSACAKGYWQWMPEAGPRFTAAGLDFRVEDCPFRDVPDYAWTPTALTPPNRVYDNADYIVKDGSVDRRDPKTCRIVRSPGCAVDSRTSLEASTEAAMLALGEAWADPDLRASGAAVQLTVGSHHAGYDDARLGVPKRFNILPAYQRWSEAHERDASPRFYGDNIRCEGNVVEEGRGFCGSELTPGTQHYAYTVIAEHILAACYYGLNYGDDLVFRAYVPLTRRKGYCAKLGIPTTEEVHTH